MLSVWSTAHGASRPGTHRGHLLSWGAAVSLQCPLWCWQSCGEDPRAQGLGRHQIVTVPKAQDV